MKRRICLIGNSHLAALKLGWADLGPEGDLYDPVFFGAHRGLLAELGLQDGALVPKSEQVRRLFVMSSNGLDRIRLADYSAFVVVALGCGFSQAMAIYKRHALANHAAGSRKHLISEECLKEAVRGTVAQSLAMRSIAKIRDGFAEAPVYYIHDPHPRAAILDSAEYREAWEIEDARNLVFSLYNRSLQEVCDAAGVVLIRQPEDTTVNSMFIDDKYSVGSVRLSESFDTHHEEGEMFHANPKYGARILQELMKELPKQNLVPSSRGPAHPERLLPDGRDLV